MIKLPPDITGRDVSQWLGNGWFVRVRGRKMEPMSLVTPLDNRHIVGLDLEGNEHTIPHSEVRAYWPVCGAVNVGPIALTIVRRQARQYRRTYNSRQVRMQIPRKWDVLKLFGPQIKSYGPNHPEVVKAVFRPWYPRYDKAVQDIQMGRAFSRAISPQVILAGTAQTMMVYYRGELTACIEGNRLVPIGVDAEIPRRLMKQFRGRLTL